VKGNSVFFFVVKKLLSTLPLYGDAPPHFPQTGNRAPPLPLILEIGLVHRLGYSTPLRYRIGSGEPVQSVGWAISSLWVLSL